MSSARWWFSREDRSSFRESFSREQVKQVVWGTYLPHPVPSGWSQQKRPCAGVRKRHMVRAGQVAGDGAEKELLEAGGGSGWGGDRGLNSCFSADSHGFWTKAFHPHLSFPVSEMG